MHSIQRRNQIGYSLHRLTSILQRTSEDLLQARLGIGFSQFRMLQVIYERPVAEQQDLALYLGQTEASVSRQAGLMKRMGLISVERDKKDARKKRVKMTAKGKLKYQNGQKVLEVLHAEAVKKLSDKQAADTEKYLNAMINAVGYSE